MADPQEAVVYCVADRLHFETPGRLPDEDSRWPQTRAAVPAGWRRGASGLWTTMTPVDAPPVAQGWKIHLSTVPGRAAELLEAACVILLARGVPFKFLRSAAALRLISEKYMARGSSGKFVAVYPPDEEWFTDLVEELADALDGFPGPYVLSDLRIGPGPVHVRYGAFVEQWCTDRDGARVLALRTPSGELVPDQRGPVFRTPDWVGVPPVLEPHLAARRDAGWGDFPYTVRKALHHSNAGGIYLAEHRVTGERVVLREARPYGGVDAEGTDAVERLHREHRALTRLQGLACVPRVHGVATAWEHHYLIEEHIEGERLLDAMIHRYPTPGRDRSPEALRAYGRWATGIADRLGAALDAVHERGLCFRDVHPGNVIVRPDGSVVLVDFEYATDLTAPELAQVGATGFAAPHGATGAEADRYGLWATWLSLLMPLVEMLGLDPGKAEVLEAEARACFGLAPAEGPRRPVIGPAPGAAAPAERDDPFAGPTADWPALRERLVAGIRSSATPDRADRLFPADRRVFADGGHTVAHGAAGVLLALHRTGAEVPDAHTDWLVAAARRARPGAGLGLYDGLHGTALALDELGRREEALETLDRARAAAEPRHAGLFGGQAGVALSLCHFAAATRDGALLDAAARTADRLDALVRDGAHPGVATPPHAGLMHGLSGAALLQLRLYRITGERRRLAMARAALERDLDGCVTMPDGTVQAKQGHRHLLYLDEGSGGIALAAREYLDHTDHPRLADLLEPVRRGCASHFVREPGLMRGRAGLIAVLAALGGPHRREEVDLAVRRLSWHAVTRDEGLFFPGMGLLRLSADLTTGTAGILLALHTAFEGKGGLLSLLAIG
ncbi:class III lanthionine synthetase LanKC [Kitasatospora sp. NPDC049285]|uniref:class III lanthionine synthetase LanKC n=1 Tax=Kitasatospora sp. NPDC049285 TaxID=3157096 RepID=UPI003427B2BB